MPFRDGAELDLELKQHLELPRCPHCAVAHPTIDLQTNFEVHPKRTHYGTSALHWFIYACQSCGGVLCAAARKNGTGSLIRNTAEWVIPAPRAARTDLPQRVQSYLDQAEETMTSPSASIVMSAAAVDAMLKARDYKTGTLYARIDEAVTAHLITSEMGQWAHDVRIDANAERHADDQSPLPTMQDARRCLDFALALGDFLFVLPARVRRGRNQPEPRQV